MAADMNYIFHSAESVYYACCVNQATRAESSIYSAQRLIREIERPALAAKTSNCPRVTVRGGVVNTVHHPSRFPFAELAIDVIHQHSLFARDDSTWHGCMIAPQLVSPATPSFAAASATRASASRRIR